MSLLSTIAPMQAATATRQNPQRTMPAATPVQGTHAEGQPRGDASGPAGAGTTAEITQTASRLPPVTAARRANAGTQARDGGDGRAQPDADTARQAVEDARAAEAALRLKVLRKEMMERIPVPVEALPKLGGDLEKMRSIETAENGPTYDTRA